MFHKSVSFPLPFATKSSSHGPLFVSAKVYCSNTERLQIFGHQFLSADFELQNSHVQLNDPSPTEAPCFDEDNTQNFTEISPPIVSKPPLPVFLLHGWLDNAATWDIMMPKLLRMTENLHNDLIFIALDLSGHGGSSHRPIGSTYSLDLYVRDFIGILGLLGMVDCRTSVSHFRRLHELRPDWYEYNVSHQCQGIPWVQRFHPSSPPLSPNKSFSS